VKDPTKGLGEVICGVDNARDMAKFDVTLATPILDSEILDVNVPRTFGRLHRIDHPNGGYIVLEENGRGLLGKTDLG
jgi:hypothetical protein